MKDIPFDLRDVFCLNKAVFEDFENLVAKGEKEIEDEVIKTAEKIFEKGKDLKIVLVSGRSASGKTTFTKKVCKKLCEMGREAKYIGLDDFLLGFKFMPKNEDGTYDMESIKGLDVALANECFRLLLTEGKADFPTFDFPNQCRGEIWNRIETGEDGIIVIEGIHALNPALTENLPEGGILRVYIEPKTAYQKDGKTVLFPEEVRPIRRIVRDELFRGWCAEKTLIQWKSVLAGEKIYIEPYIDFAEIKVDSSVIFEPVVFVEILTEMLERISEESPFFEMAKEILEKIGEFSSADKEILPKDSLLREFLG